MVNLRLGRHAGASISSDRFAFECSAGKLAADCGSAMRVEGVPTLVVATYKFPFTFILYSYSLTMRYYACVVVLTSAPYTYH